MTSLIFCSAEYFSHFHHSRLFCFGCMTLYFICICCLFARLVFHTFLASCRPSCRLVLRVCLIHLSVYVCWIRMAQNSLVNYRHLLSKRGVCCQVLQHEVSLMPRDEKAGRGVELHGQMLCHVLLDCVSSHRLSSVIRMFTHASQKETRTCLTRFTLINSASCRDYIPTKGNYRDLFIGK